MWKDDSKKEFIDTIKKGFPFGSLLLYELKEKQADNFKYQIIDGLQRFSTIQDYENDKFKYINFDDIANNDCLKIFDSYEKVYQSPLSQSVKDEMVKFIKELFKEYKDNEDSNLSTFIIRRLSDQFAFIKNDKLLFDVMDIIGNIEKRIKNEIDLSILSLPVIIFRGDECDLPAVFEKINSNGTKLSRYDVYAASWNNKLLKIDDKEILRCVEDRYENMMDNTNLIIDGYQSGNIIAQKEINLFEYAYAIGKLIKKQCPDIFANAKNNDKNDDSQTDSQTDSQIDSIGFSLLVVCLGGSMKQMMDLPKYIKYDEAKNLIILKDKLIECSKSVNDTLKKYIVSSDGKKNYTKYMEAQIVSIIATLFKIRYTISDGLKIQLNNNSGVISDRFKKHMPKHYLYDIIRGYWGNSGDTKVADLLKYDINDNKYIKSIEDEAWQTTLYNDWMIEQEKKPSQRLNIIQKLFLNYLYTISPKSQASLSNKGFDFEHIIPLNRLKVKFKDGPFAAIGNLCFLPIFENRSKKDITLYEYIDEQISLSILDSNTILDQLNYPDRTEIDFIKGVDFTEDNFKKFLRNRHNYLVKKFIELIRRI